ncbi:MAG: type II toxin-antitoxin system RelE/ParE family toxin [Desulfobulbaceae bacterium]
MKSISPGVIVYYTKLKDQTFFKMGIQAKYSEKGTCVCVGRSSGGNFEANLGGHIYKKRIRLEGQGKSGGGRTIICYKKNDWAIFIHGFAKNEKSNLSPKELNAFKELAKILFDLSPEDIAVAIKNGDFIEVKP